MPNNIHLPSNNATWDQIRITGPVRHLYNGVWFSNATPKYSLFIWLATHINRFTMRDIGMWRLETTYSLLVDTPHIFGSTQLVGYSIIDTHPTTRISSRLYLVQHTILPLGSSSGTFPTLRSYHMV